VRTKVLRVQSSEFLGRMIYEGIYSRVNDTRSPSGLYKIRINMLKTFGKMFSRNKFLLMPCDMISNAGMVVEAEVCPMLATDFRSSYGMVDGYRISEGGIILSPLLFTDSLTVDNIGSV